MNEYPMNEYPSNSNITKKTSNDQEKKLNKVTTAVANKKKKTGINKFFNLFIAEDMTNIKNYIVMDVLVPAVKDAVTSIITNGAKMLFYGEISNGNNKDRVRADSVSYGKYYTEKSKNEPSRLKPRAVYEYDDIVLGSMGDAQLVLNKLDECIRQYGTASVADLYDLVGITSTSFTDNKYGWTDLRYAKAERVDGGYLIKLPRAVALD